MGMVALETGQFSPPALVGPVPFAEIKRMKDKAEAALQAFDPEQVNSWDGKDLRSSDWSATHPFHCRALYPLVLAAELPPSCCDRAYDILRHHGVPTGKRDHEGELRTSDQHGSTGITAAPILGSSD